MASIVLFAVGCSSQNSSIEPEEPDSYVVSYYLDGEKIDEQSLIYGGYATKPNYDSDELIVVGWYTSEDYDTLTLWDFKEQVTENLNLYAYSMRAEAATLEVIFMSNGNIYETQSVKYGDYARDIIPDEIEGYEFCGWYFDKTVFDFKTVVTENLILTAKWMVKEYTVTFKADNVTVSEIRYNIENNDISIPDVPQKQYYIGEWDDVVLTTGDVTINAIYTPITYNAEFIIDGILYTQIQYTVEDTPFDYPSIPEKTGYTSNWDKAITGGDVTLNAIYTPIKYTITFIYSNEVLSTSYFTVEDKELSEPEVDNKQGFEHNWEYTVETSGDIIAELKYTPIEYNVTFIARGELIQIITYTAFTESITSPDIPAAEGYDCYWEDYDISMLQNLTVEAVFTPIKYYAEFIAEDLTVSTVPFTIESKSIEEPEVPEKKGYSGNWESYTLGCSNIVIRAEYAPINYTIKFIAENIIVSTLSFTVETENISEPDVPEKSGYYGVWENYTLTCSDIIVNAVYTRIIDTSVFTYNLLSDNTYAITGYTGNGTDIVIPSEYNGLPIKSIAANSFVNKSFKSVEISNGIEHIGNCAFQSCIYLENIILPDSLISIGSNAFEKNAFSEILLPNTLESIGDYAFTNCNNLQQIAIPDKIAIIKECTFYSCLSLNIVYLSDSVSEIEMYAFADCPSLESVQCNSIINISDNAFGIIASSEKFEINVIVPNGSKIDSGAFSGRKTYTVEYCN